MLKSICFQYIVETELFHLHSVLALQLLVRIDCEVIPSWTAQKLFLLHLLSHRLRSARSPWLIVSEPSEFGVKRHNSLGHYWGKSPLNGATMVCEEEAGQRCHGAGSLGNQTYLPG